MNSSINNSAIENKLKNLVSEIWNLAEKSQDDIFDLLLILRELELLHRNIRQEMFEPVLPDTRHRLYLLLKHIEEVGGWPYIERMRVKDICQKLLSEEESSSL
ncbi:hypothetical protein GM3708_2531 [Geminocystis sp. NIES-3708]|uniref:hypothetical protein n=1 Tax=Geminocystis sp. NIES-3708 TaxID=1615909 RepID=UPI0005FC7D2B|nr:hypothetical protein [Geminocystis sp. NIES-3708]BAQ62125.1 hypothetical protein GM3708_2531 [Geminocystis sp. NIES-3708]